MQHFCCDKIAACEQTNVDFALQFHISLLEIGTLKPVASLNMPIQHVHGAIPVDSCSISS